MTAYTSYPFDKSEFSEAIESIETANNNVSTEPHYNEIAKSLLIKYHGFQDVAVGPRVSEMKGVPFDLVATKGNQKILFEVKGARKAWSKSGPTQLARMKLLFEGLAEKGIDVDLFLIQISLSNSEYRLWDTEGVKTLLTDGHIDWTENAYRTSC